MVDFELQSLLSLFLKSHVRFVIKAVDGEENFGFLVEGLGEDDSKSPVGVVVDGVVGELLALHLAPVVDESLVQIELVLVLLHAHLVILVYFPEGLSESVEAVSDFEVEIVRVRDQGDAHENADAENQHQVDSHLHLRALLHLTHYIFLNLITELMEHFFLEFFELVEEAVEFLLSLVVVDVFELALEILRSQQRHPSDVFVLQVVVDVALQAAEFCLLFL